MRRSRFQFFPDLERPLRSLGLIWAVALMLCGFVYGGENVMLTEVPDYSWYAGCYGTAAGNLMGFWDRHGLPNLYTGPTAGGVAPLNSDGPNVGIRSMWATRAGFDGRPANKPGHVDDYWSFYFSDGVNSYESTARDPYVIENRPEHSPDCICDFIGASQNKWKNLDGECDGNIDAYAVIYWDHSGDLRLNYDPPAQEEVSVRDVPSGLRAWAKARGYNGDVFSQLTDFNPTIPARTGFSFENLKAEIDAGYPVILALQRFDEFSRRLPNMPNANPDIHGMLAFGYVVTDDGRQFVRYRTSWGGSGDNRVRAWNSDDWEAQLPVRGIVGFHPQPRIVGITRSNGILIVKWHGPSSVVKNLTTGESTIVHRYILERSSSLSPETFQPVSNPTTDLEAAVPNCCSGTTFFRVRLARQ